MKLNRISFTAFGVALLGGLVMFAPPAAQAQDDDAFSLQSLLGDDSSISIGGWTQGGYHTHNNGVFNTHPNDVNLHQQWLYLEKVADGSEGFDWGFRVDGVYGVDAQNTQAFGEPAPQDHWDNDWDNGIYGWAIPQAYGELAMDDWSVKIGHFYTIIGYEVVTAPDNFFYSHAFTFNFNEPFTHTGALVTYNASDDVTVYGGWTAGWDTGFDRFADGDNTRGSNFLGGISVALGENTTATYALTAGDLGTRGEGYSHSVVVDTNLTDDLNYVFQTDLVETSTRGDSTFAVNNYLFYTINDMLKAGVRAEWWKVTDSSIYEITAGVNVRPADNIVIRPEVRWQFGDSNADEAFFLNNFGVTSGDTIFGVDAILTY